MKVSQFSAIVVGKEGMAAIATELQRSLQYSYLYQELTIQDQNPAQLVQYHCLAIAGERLNLGSFGAGCLEDVSQLMRDWKEVNVKEATAGHLRGTWVHQWQMR